MRDLGQCSTVTILSNAKSCSWLPFNLNSTRQSLFFQALKFSQVLGVEGTALTLREAKAGREMLVRTAWLLPLGLLGKEMEEDTAFRTASHLPLKTPGTPVRGICINPKEIFLRLQDLQGGSMPLAFNPAVKISSK